MNTTKKCPLCAEEIPHAAATCEYCGAQFKVTSTGYCQNCHQVREADGNGQCKVCGNKVMDLRVESRLIEKQVQEPLPVSQPIAQNEIPQTRKSRLPIGILAGILILAVIGASLWFGRNNIPAVSSLFATSTLTATTTFTPTLIPSPTSTQTPRPTATAPPLPTWVSDFAEPILSAIADRPPTIQDDFHDNSGGWYSNFYRTDYLRPIKFIDGELVLDNCEAYRSKMGFKNFVLEIDGRFLPGTEGGNPQWKIVFRAQGPANPQYAIGIHYDGFLNISMHSEGFHHPAIQANGGFTNNHILLIAKGSEFALYVNGQPLYHWQYTLINQGGYTHFDLQTENNEHAVVALDNLKIWDISDLP